MIFYIRAPFALEVDWELEEMMGNHPIGLPACGILAISTNTISHYFLHFSLVSAASGARHSSSAPNSIKEVGNVSAYFPFHFVDIQCQVDAGDLLNPKKTSG